MRTKDLTSLLRLLQVSGQSGVLYVEPPAINEGEAWQAQMLLTQGEVVSCRIVNKRSGQVIVRNRDAMDWLTQLGTLQWWIDEKSGPLIDYQAQPPSQRSSGNTDPLPLRRLSANTDPLPLPPTLGNTDPLSPAQPHTETYSAPFTDDSILPPAGMKGPPPSRSVHKAGAGIVPQRVSATMPTLTGELRREHQEVWMLIDGQRTLADLAALLHKSPQSIFRLLMDLRATGFIVLRNE